VLKEPINLSDEERRLFTTKPREVTAYVSEDTAFQGLDTRSAIPE
jgi:hypothetical protein